MNRGAVADWAHAYAAAWETRDERAVIDLFAAGATYRSHAFRAPHRGHEGIAGNWRRATSSQRDISVAMGEPLVDGDRAALEWWAQMRDAEDGRITLPGVLMLTFAGTACTSLHEYWHLQPGRIASYPGWGRMASGAPGSARESADVWAARYEDAWRNRDADAAAALYAEEAVVRTHPFRDPAIGRAGVRSYCDWAYGSEKDIEARVVPWASADRAAAVEWWASFEDADEGAAILAGCSLLHFDTAGLVTEAREYWNQRAGTIPAPEWWGVDA